MYSRQWEFLLEKKVVGFRSQTELNELIDLPVIGFFITHHNVKGQSLDETKQLVDEIQTKRQENGFPKALIATDQEGGRVSRLSPPLKLQSSLGELLEANSKQAHWICIAEFTTALFPKTQK